MGQSGSASELSNTMIVPLLLLGLAASSPVDRHARQTSMVLVRAGEGQRFESRQSNDVEEIKVPAGEAVDIFYRYGFFSLSVRVVPRDDHGSWLIREPTTKVFSPNSLRQVKELREGKFEPQFQIFFCDDVEDLMKHYFHDFTAEGVAEPYRLYTGSWRTPTTVKYFGLSEDTLHSDSGFVLVKLQKPRLTVRTEGEPRLMPEAAREFSKIRIGDEESVKSFTEDFGSHYIKSLTVGDAVYQILALDRAKYQRARQEVLVEKRVTDFNQIYEQFLAPWMVKESGAVQAASGDPRVKALLDNRAITQTQFSSYPSIFEILTEGTQAITALSFRSIGALLPSVQAQDYYNEIVNTQLALGGEHLKWGEREREDVWRRTKKKKSGSLQRQRRCVRVWF